MEHIPDYDDVHKTMIKDCPELLISVVNEVHNEHFTGEEKVEFGNREHMINQQDDIQKRISDNCFKILSEKVKSYHMECQMPCKNLTVVSNRKLVLHST